MVKIIRRHSFADEICRCYGIQSAVILNTFAYWTAKAEISKRVTKKGTPFFSCTFDGLLSEFSCLKGDEISKAIHTLLDAEILYSVGKENPNSRVLYYGVDFDLLSQMGLGDLKRLAIEDAERDATLEAKFSEDIERIYKAYPVRCPIRRRPIKKTVGDKVAISRLLDEGFTADEFVSAIQFYASDCENSGNYICDLAKFLSDFARGYLFTQKQPVAEAIDITIPEEPIAPQAPVAPQPQPSAPVVAQPYNAPQPQPVYQPQPMPQSQSRYQAPQTIDGCVDGFIALYPKKHKGYYGEGEMINFPRIDEATKYLVASELFEQNGIAEYPTACKVLKFIRARIEDEGIVINDFISDYAKYKDEYEKSIPKIRMSITVYVSYYEYNLIEEIKNDYDNPLVDSDLFVARWGLTREVYNREFRSKGLIPPVEIVDNEGKPLTQDEINAEIRQREEERERDKEMYADY